MNYNIVNSIKYIYLAFSLMYCYIVGYYEKGIEFFQVGEIDKSLPM